MSLYNSFKSITYKQKYYCISYKLNFIFNSSLPIHIRCKSIQLTENKYVYSKFLFDKYKIKDGYKIEYYQDGKLHRDNKPAVIKYYYNEHVQLKIYYQHGKYHRTNGPAYISYYLSGIIEYEIYFQDNLYHRIDGPAFIKYNRDGTHK